MAEISKEVNIEMLEKLPDGTYKLKYPKTRSTSGITFDAHLDNKSNPHGVTKAQVALGSVQNYGLATKTEAEAGTSNVKYMTPLRTAEATLKMIEGKVDKETGKGLSTNDYTTVEKNKLSGIQAGAQVNTVTSVAGKTGAVTVTKGDVGLGSVDNVKQASKVEFDALDTKVSEHVAEKATQNKLGHVKVDGRTIFVNEEGVISVNNPYLHDFSGSPGSGFLIAGTMEEGFFGEVSASELITGDALASECGISQGISQHSTAGWLKFAYKGEIQFIAKKPIRHSISWDAINTAKCVYGDSGDKTVTIDYKTYKVTLMRALEPSNDPKTVASGNSGAVNHHSEWNRLMCQIHEEAINGSWGYPDNIESDIGILEHSLGSGSQGMYSDADLIVASGDGRSSWCQEMSTSTSYRLRRGYTGVSYSYNNTSSTATSNIGWRPVLKLVP